MKTDYVMLYGFPGMSAHPSEALTALNLLLQN